MRKKLGAPLQVLVDDFLRDFGPVDEQDDEVVSSLEVVLRNLQ